MENEENQDKGVQDERLDDDDDDKEDEEDEKKSSRGKR